ncbi:hybrid sensor histidine kinase/response regulator [Chroococcidiopsis sp. FACHB-1243]|uniref:hybrid sensor histidine kinase/response regulator n=1 Tax=Chroococcidiopsis sp. [FACHB-1243] TaxID=2692781 RepID=UPI0017853AE3|nr:hybrid sensor histidine kinase/response regulator [Chroococcidiopsis sp. [FACHB-1243]]MBD2307937.1 hybrid sensor histidine kinase/response regulator [Chroococcidiopsis sp. [FACHB-1243]]
MIDDPELRDIYKTACAERMQKLEECLMHLEKHPGDREQLEDFLREIHTLKGDSRMLGVQGVETLTHQIEEVLAGVKRGESNLTVELCDRLYQGLDAMRQFVHEAVTGVAPSINLFYVLARLMGAQSSPASEDEELLPAETPIFTEPVATADIPLFENDLFPEPPVTALEDDLFSEPSFTKPSEAIAASFDLLDDDFFLPEPPVLPKVLPTPASLPVKQPEPVPIPEAKAKPQPALAAEASETAQTSNHQIDTIRVEPQKLDTLMTQAGELTVTKLRIAQRMGEIEEILTLWEEWSRDAFVHRSVFDKIERGLQTNNIKQLQNFQHRSEQRLERLGSLINHLKSTAYEDTARLDIVTGELESGIKTLRLLPLSNMFALFPRLVRDLAKQQGKEINLVIEGGDTKADKRILEEMKDPLLHLLRNAVDHGIETPQERENSGKPRTATIHLRGYQTASSIGIEVTDDGRGLNIDSIKRTAVRRGLHREEELEAMTTAQIQSLIFAPGFSTRTTVTEISGRGVGLDVVRANVERMKGTIQIESLPGMGCEFRIKLDTTLATTQVLIVEVNRMSYALPVEFVQTNLLVSRQDIFALEGSQTIAIEGQPISVAWLDDLLELPAIAPSLKSAAKMLPCVVLQVGGDRLGLLVDALLDRQDIVLKPQSKLLKRIRNVTGATILGTGEVCMVLNPQDLLKSVQKKPVAIHTSEFQQVQTKQKLLLVEDSIIIRTQVKRLLEGAGYDVTATVDGADGFNKLRTGSFDAVISDVQMPNLDGLGLAAKIRQHKEYQELPIILVTTLASDEDKRRGAEAGANAYLTKSTFDQKLLLDTLNRLI